MTTVSSAFFCVAACTIALASSVTAQQSSAGQNRETMKVMAEALRSGPQGFSVTLILGDMLAAPPQDNVPAAARKALADMKDFLPFRSYRLLDVQWTLCCGRSPVVTRLRGPEDQDYELELNPSLAMDGRGKISVRFLLREPGSADAGRRVETAFTPNAESLALEVRALEAQLAEQRRRYADNHPDIVASRSRISDLQRKLEVLNNRGNGQRQRGMAAGPVVRSRAIIDASFMMDIGETVVVGTSRVKGADKALIALLTAVPQRSALAK